MIAIKNISPGVLLVADRRLRLEPGRVVEVDSLSPEIERALALGLVVRFGREAPAARVVTPTKTEPLPVPEAAPAADPPPPPDSSTPDDLSKLSPNEALDRIAGETDATRLRAWLGGERRKGIADTIRRRISEVSGAAR